MRKTQSQNNISKLELGLNSWHSALTWFGAFGGGPTQHHTWQTLFSICRNNTMSCNFKI